MLLKSELKRIIYNPLVIISIVISVIFQVYSIYNEFSPHINSIMSIAQENYPGSFRDLVIFGEELNTYDGWIIGFKGYVISIIFLSCIPFSYSYIIDKQSGFSKNIIIRSNKRKYFVSKVICNSIIGGLVPTVSALISFLIVFALFNNEIPSKLMPLIIFNGAFTEYLLINPIIYVFIVLSILFVIGAIYSTFSLAIGVLTEKIIPCLLLPQIYWLAGSLFFESFVSNELAPWNIFYFWTQPMYFNSGVVHSFIILAISIIIIYYKYKEDVL